MYDTLMPLALAYDKSTLSRPIPTRLMSFSESALSRTLAVIGSVPSGPQAVRIPGGRIPVERCLLTSYETHP